MILRADARHIPLADKSVQCVVTSPPYWGLRDYGIAGQIGLEATPETYVATMVGVFREVWRVLKDDGTVWLNLGDSYASSWACKRRNVIGNGSPDDSVKRGRTGGGLKEKDLCGMPWRVAFALQADGWYLRSDIIWAKPNPMPESVTDRPTRSHEYIFLLSKSERYFYDADAIREPSAPDSADNRRAFRGLGDYTANQSFHSDHRNGNQITGNDNNPVGRNKRDVWTMNSEPTPEAHFATFPQKLIEPCILAGTSEKGECVMCGKNWVREVEIEGARNESWHNHENDLQRGQRGKPCPPGYARLTTGWRPQCACSAPTRPNIVLDPFLGSGTIGKVCERFGHRWIGLELSADYIGIAQRRTAQMGLLLGFGAKP